MRDKEQYVKKGPTRRDLLILAASALTLKGLVKLRLDNVREKNEIIAITLNNQIALIESDPNRDYFNNYLQPIVKAHSLAGLLGQRLAKKDRTLEFYTVLFENAAATTIVKTDDDIRRSVLQTGEHVPVFWRERLDLQFNPFKNLRYADTELTTLLDALNQLSSLFGDFTPELDKKMRLQAKMNSEHPGFNVENNQKLIYLEKITLEQQIGKYHNFVSPLLIKRPRYREDNKDRVKKWVYDALEVAKIFKLFSPDESDIFQKAYLGDKTHPSEPDVFYNQYKVFD